LAHQTKRTAALRPFLVAFVLITLLVNSMIASAAENTWPTTRFKVFVGNPYTGSVMHEIFGSYDWIEFEDLYDTPSDEVIAEIERAFSEAASWYKRRGFPPPDLEPLIDTEEGRAYRVYLCDYEEDQRLWNWVVDHIPPGIVANIAGNINNAVGWSMCGANPKDPNDVASGLYVGPCQGVPYRTRIMIMNRGKSFDANGNLTETGHQTVAHEMMHAIMSNTPFSRSNRLCHDPNKPDKWITEGIPDAIGYDIAEELWENRYYTPGTKFVPLSKRHGYRPYAERLPQDGILPVPGFAGQMSQGDYGTSSFWRFVADAYPGGWKVLLTEKSDGAPGLLYIPLPDTNTDWVDEVRWLDKGLRGKFNLGLKEMYGLFVSNFAFRPASYSIYQGKPAEDNIEHWAGMLFNECKEVDLSSNGKQDFTLKIKGLASACVLVEPTGAPGMVQISFIAGHDDLSLLQSISIGRSGTTLLSRASPIAHTPNAPTQYTAAWRDFPQDGSERTLYIFSNVAKDPGLTKERELTFTAVMPGNTNSARATVPLPPKSASKPQQPSYDRHAKRLSRQKSDTSKMVQEQMNLDKQSLNPNVSASTQVNRSLNLPDCPEPFKYTPCGPQLSIGLSLMPGSYIIPGQTNTAGGAAGQVMSGLQAMAQTSMFDSQQRMEYLADTLETIDGSDVSITMPLVDYGYKGSFDRAAITVNMAGKDRSCTAITPSGETQMPRLAGRVTIEEYSPVVLIGSFVAPLVESVEGGGYRSCGTVSGRFTSVAPFQNHEGTEIVMEGTEEMTDDIVNSLGLPADMVYKMRQEGTLVPQGSNTSGSSGPSTGGGGTIGGECSCECASREFADDLCELFCEEEFAACD
jgi:hypothetical protein